MRIEIIKNVVLPAHSQRDNQTLQAIFPAGKYVAKLTHEGKIELVNPENKAAYFSFSQFREKVSCGEFVVVEN
jgi:hypothetical protein